MKLDRFLIAAGICVTAFSCTSAYGQGKIKVIKPKQQPAAASDQSSEPDKILYDRAMADLKHRRFTEERLSLQTLINTYPDSEYLAKAKLGVADSYYKEGGVSNLTQAIAEYKSFIVFFPFLDEAAYAQMQVGMAHFKMMEKSDRDNSEAENAEAELQTFLIKYPQSKLAPIAEQDLRDVQEVLADGEYRVARFYYLRPDYRASAARLVDLTERYPLYSQSDEALWMLGDIYSLMKKKGSRNEDDKNHWADLEAKCYDRIIVNYPLSPRAAQAKDELKAMGMAIPTSDPAAVARMQKQETYARAHRQKSLVKDPMGILKSGPDFSMAAQSGMPNLDPPPDIISAKDILTPTATGPTFNLSATRSISASDDGGASEGTVVPAEATDDSTVDSSSSATSSGSGSSADEVGVIDAPTTAATPEQPAAAVPASDASGNGTAGTNPAATTTTDSPNSQQAAAPSSSQSSSSSKKKKGLSKLNPF